MINIELLRSLCLCDKLKWTLHVLNRMKERKILSQEIIDTILHGEIIVQYQHDKPFPSCLLYNSNNLSPLHVVVSTDGMHAHIITAYIPSHDEWKIDFKTRKE